MHRKEFIKKCGLGCVAILAGASVIQSCTSTKYVTGSINQSFLEFSESEFQVEKKGEVRSLPYLVVENEKLKYPVVVYKKDDSYRALLMRCTHQGTELQVFGDTLQCPAHGSEFNSSGNVQNGPADENLRSFPVINEGQTLKIDLT